MKALGWALLLLSLSAQAQASRLVKVEWESIPSADSYDIEISELRGTPLRPKDPILVNTQALIWALQLEPGLYQMRVRSRDARKAPGAWSTPRNFDVGLENAKDLSPKDGEKVLTTEDKTAIVHFTWGRVEGANEYQFDLKSADETLKMSKLISGNSIDLKLPVAVNYRWTVQARTTTGLSSVSPTGSAFALWGKGLSQPELRVKESESNRRLEWSKPPQAQTFRTEIAYWDPAENAWARLRGDRGVKTTQLNFHRDWPEGQYRFAVQAHSELRQIPPSRFIFSVSDPSLANPPRRSLHPRCLPRKLKRNPTSSD